VRRLLFCLIGIMALGACGDPAGQSPAAQAPTETGAAKTGATGAAAAVPDSLAFSAARVGGGTVDLGDYAGRPVLLWFWAPT
jgi:hypothetical protein